MSRRTVMAVLAAAGVGGVLAGCGKKDPVVSEVTPDPVEGSDATTDAGSQDDADEEGAAPSHVVSFEVYSGTASAADITVTTVDASGQPVSDTLAGQALPYAMSTMLPVEDLDPATLSVEAYAVDGEDVTVSISVDGADPVTATGEGEGARAKVDGAGQ